MGIFGALTTAISGLQAQSFALENISGNIANSRTTGFKRVDTSFADLVPDTPPRRALSGSVGSFSKNTTTVQGDLQTSQIGTNMGISGEGFFVVREPTGTANGQPLFTGANHYTRRGDFQPDVNGNLVNGTGNALMGYPLDATTGAKTGPLQVLKISSANLPASATTNIDYQATLPKIPRTAAYTLSNNTPGAELLSVPLQLASIPTASATQFESETITGQQTTVYDAVGSPISVNLQWAKTSNAPGAETWSLYYQSDTTGLAANKWTRISNAVTFNASGQLTAPATGILPVTFTVDGATSPAINLSFGTSGLNQFAIPDGQVIPSRIAQDGYPTGSLQRVDVAQGGRISGSYSNGQTVGLAELPLANFANPDGLKRLDGGTFEQTLDSGQELLVAAGNDIVGGTTEASNVDIADEFSKMIVTQQAYSANTRVVTTAQTMLQDVINIIR